MKKREKWILGIGLSMILCAPLVTIPLYVSKNIEYTSSNISNDIIFSEEKIISEQFDKVNLDKKITKIYIDSIREINSEKELVNSNLVGAIIFVQDEIYRRTVTNNDSNEVILSNIQQIKSILNNDILAFKKLALKKNFNNTFLNNQIDFCIKKLQGWNTMVGIEQYRMISNYLELFSKSYAIENEIDSINNEIANKEIALRELKISENNQQISTKRNEISNSNKEAEALMKAQELLFEYFGPDSSNTRSSEMNVRSAYNIVIGFLGVMVATDATGLLAIALSSAFITAVIGAIAALAYTVAITSLKISASATLWNLSNVMINNIENSKLKGENLDKKLLALKDFDNIDSFKKIFTEINNGRTAIYKSLINLEKKLASPLITSSVKSITSNSGQIIAAAANLIIDSLNLDKFVKNKEKLIEPFEKSDENILLTPNNMITERVKSINGNSAMLISQIDKLNNTNIELKSEIDDISSERQVQSLSINMFKNFIETNSSKSFDLNVNNFGLTKSIKSMSIEQLKEKKLELVSKTFEMKKLRESSINEFELKYDNSDKDYWENMFDNVYENNISNINEYNKK